MILKPVYLHNHSFLKAFDFDILQIPTSVHFHICLLVLPKADFINVMLIMTTPSNAHNP